MSAPPPPWIRESPGGVDLQLYIQPRASRTRAVGTHGDALKLQVAAPPVDGEANAELVEFLARTLGVTRTSVQLLAGDGARRKRVRVLGSTVDAVLQALGEAGR